MSLHLYNSLSGTVEEFAPAQDNLVRFYACGPTVYDYGHIGNFRTFVAVDILRRHLLQSGRQLLHVMNITDVDDKIIRNANQKGVPIGEYTAKYEKAFLEDMDALGIQQPERISRATENIPEMIALSRVWPPRTSPTRPRMEAGITASANFPSTASSARKTSPG